MDIVKKHIKLGVQDWVDEAAREALLNAYASTIESMAKNNVIQTLHLYAKDDSEYRQLGEDGKEIEVPDFDRDKLDIVCVAPGIVMLRLYYNYIDRTVYLNLFNKTVLVDMAIVVREISLTQGARKDPAFAYAATVIDGSHDIRSIKLDDELFSDLVVRLEVDLDTKLPVVREA